MRRCQAVRVSDALVRWSRSHRGDATGIAIVAVNYNTRDHIALLLWSIHQTIRDQVRSVVVVDNGSTDGSRVFLEGCAKAGVCDLIANDTNRYHGPALNQAVSHLALLERQDPIEPIGWIWLLDSDCVVVRPETLTHAVTAATKHDAALTGERRWDPWHRCNRLAPHSLLLDPAQAWQPTLAAFDDGGDPTYELERSCIAARLSVVAFPFVSEGYVVHRGRSTLAGVHARGEDDNQHYDWATTHHEPHFELVPGAARAYAKLVGQFTAAVPILETDGFVDACLPSS